MAARGNLTLARNTRDSTDGNTAKGSAAVMLVLFGRSDSLDTGRASRAVSVDSVRATAARLELGIGVNALVVLGARDSTSGKTAGAVGVVTALGLGTKLSLNLALAASHDGDLGSGVDEDSGSTTLETTGLKAATSSRVAPSAGVSASNSGTAREHGAASAADGVRSGEGQGSVLVGLAGGEALVDVGNTHGRATSESGTGKAGGVLPSAGLVPGDGPVRLQKAKTDEATLGTGGDALLG